MAALWERKARRYRDFEHLKPQFEPATATRARVTTTATPAGAFELSPYESCGYELGSFSAPFTALFVTWTVPDLQFTPNPPFGLDPNLFRTFVTLGSIRGGLDIHVEMTVDSANTVTSQLWAEFDGNVNLPISPGDVISGSLCLNAQPPGAGAYFFVNETRGQTMSFPVTTGLPPATFILADVARGGLPAAASPRAGPVRGRLFRRNQRLHHQRPADAHLGRRRHHDRPKRQRPRHSRKAQRLGLQSGKGLTREPVDLS
jgi:hypothetical protein